MLAAESALALHKALSGDCCNVQQITGNNSFKKYYF